MILYNGWYSIHSPNARSRTARAQHDPPTRHCWALTVLVCGSMLDNTKHIIVLVAILLSSHKGVIPFYYTIYGGT